MEVNRQSQPSQQGFSLLGNRCPTPGSVDPKLNLNNQPWSLPVVFDNTHASLRVQHKLDRRLARCRPRWACSACAPTTATLAYAYGLHGGTFDGTYYGDRFCPDGTL